MKIKYAVPWIEVEYGWGDRPEGYKVFDDLDQCKIHTSKDSETGNYRGGYMGPIRPLHYYETPDEINIELPGFVKNLTYKGNPMYF